MKFAAFKRMLNAELELRNEAPVSDPITYFERKGLSIRAAADEIEGKRKAAR
jgi:hypothetical protein